MAVQPVHSPPTLVEHVVATLTELILSGSEPFRPGTRLRVALLTEMFHTSPTPIKEALRQLHSQGLVTINPRRGASVAAMSTRDFEELFALRAELEVVSLRLAPADLDGAVLDELAAVVGEMRLAVAAEKAVEYHRLDCRFHSLIARLSGNSRLIGFYDDLMNQYRIRPAYMSTTSAGMLQSLHGHEEILNLLRRGQLDRVQERILEHYRRARMRSHPSVAREGQSDPADGGDA